jgi:hypothetical protein
MSRKDDSRMLNSILMMPQEVAILRNDDTLFGQSERYVLQVRRVLQASAGRSRHVDSSEP